MTIEYKTVNVWTESGIALAERLKATGWQERRVGLFTVLFSRKRPKRPRRKVKWKGVS